MTRSRLPHLALAFVLAAGMSSAQDDARDSIRNWEAPATWITADLTAPLHFVGITPGQRGRE